MDITIGADPEVFVKHNGKHVSAHGLVPGTKQDPFKVDLGAVQVDGMALEFNILPAAKEEDFITNINTVINQLAQMVPDYELDFIPAVNFGKEYIEAQPDDAKELGCDPDYNAWNQGKANPRPNGGEEIRTAAGHVHIGWTEGVNIASQDHLLDCIDLAKALDLYLGVPSMLIDPDTTRRQLYGRAGAFRPKPYGMEYRVLSNFWVKDPKYISWVYRNVHKAVARLCETKDIDEVYNTVDPWQVHSLINGGFGASESKRRIEGIFRRMNGKLEVPE